MAEDNVINHEGRRQYRDIVKANVGRIERLKRNVLEISLEKQNYFDRVEHDVIQTFLCKIGIRKEQVEGVQIIPPKAPRKVFVWLVPEVN